MRDDSMALGKRLKAIREDRGLSQENVANELGCHKTNVAHIEGGRHQPSVEQLRTLARLFECSMEQLVEGDIPRRAPAPPVARVTRQMTREQIEDALNRHACESCGGTGFKTEAA